MEEDDFKAMCKEHGGSFGYPVEGLVEKEERPMGCFFRENWSDFKRMSNRMKEGEAEGRYHLQYQESSYDQGRQERISTTIELETDADGDFKSVEVSEGRWSEVRDLRVETSQLVSHLPRSYAIDWDYVKTSLLKAGKW